jgi:hypothetical protein
MSVTFFYPSTGTVTSTITLKNPDYGDSEQYDNNVTYHIGMDGSVSSYKKSLKQALLLNFSGILKADAEEFEQFFINNSGHELGYTDTLDRGWKVRIINNPLDVVATISISNCELKSYTVQMRAVEDTGRPDNALIDDFGNVLVDDVGNVLVYT